MNGANGETNKARLGPNGEELDGVLGRFEDWARTRRVNPLASYGASAGIDTKAVSAKARLVAEARELSYEQALKASRYRRPVEAFPVDAVPSPADLPDTVEPLQAEPEVAPVILPASVSKGPLPGTTLPVLPAKAVKTPRKAIPKVAPVDAVPVIAEAVELLAEPPVEPTVTAAVDPPATRPPREQTAASQRIKQRSAERVVRKAKPAPQLAAPRRQPSAKRPSQVTAAALPALQPKAAAVKALPNPPVKQSPRRPAFQDVLKASIALPPELLSADVGKSSSLTLRISEAEQMKIQTRAAQAKLSVSAYVRQCALGADRGLRDAHEHRSVSAYLRRCVTGMEELQEQVQVLAAREHPAPPAPGLSAIPGILGRFFLRCVGILRLRRTPEAEASAS